MKEEEKRKLKKKLKELITNYENEILELESTIKPIKPENSLGRISRMDAINNQSVMEAAMRSKKRKLGKLKIALQNIDNKSFGYCSLCKKPIPMGRLIYMPESTRCVNCADR